MSPGRRRRPAPARRAEQRPRPRARRTTGRRTARPLRGPAARSAVRRWLFGWRGAADREPVLPAEELADDRQEPRPALVGRRDEAERQLRERRRLPAAEPLR